MSSSHPTSATTPGASPSRVQNSGTTSSSIHSLPAEIIERILTFSGPRDVARYACTCRYAHKLVYEGHDQFLWRELFLGRPYDDLRKAIPVPRGRPMDLALAENRPEKVTEDDARWRSEVQKRTMSELIALSHTNDPQLLEAAYEAFLTAIDTAIPVEELEGKSKSKDEGGDEQSSSRSENLRWLDRLLRKTRVLDTLPEYTPAANPSISSTSTKHTPSVLGDAPVCETSGTSGQSEDLEEEDTESDDDDYAEFANRHENGGPHAYSDDLTCPESVPPQFQRVHQMRSRLRAYVALAHENSWEHESQQRMANLRKAARAYVYDMRRYKMDTLWGPYRVGDDGRTVLVDWEHIAHVVTVVGLKLRDVPIPALGYHKKPLFQIDALRAYSAVGALNLPESDWAGVTGTWRRYVCFMDYRDLFMFNYSNIHPGPRNPEFFNPPFDEALRPVELEFELMTQDEYFSEPNRIPIDPSTPRNAPLSAPVPIGDYEDPAFPTLYFKGRSHGGLHFADATIRGKVSTLSDGAVRWQFVTTYDGRMQWSAEAVQLGHVCSAAGIAGIWTGAHHDRDDPAGPFWMIRVNDDLPAGVLNALH